MKMTRIRQSSWLNPRKLSCGVARTSTCTRRPLICGREICMVEGSGTGGVPGEAGEICRPWSVAAGGRMACGEESRAAGLVLGVQTVGREKVDGGDLAEGILAVSSRSATSCWGQERCEAVDDAIRSVPERMGKAGRGGLACELVVCEYSSV